MSVLKEVASVRGDVHATYPDLNHYTLYTCVNILHYTPEPCTIMCQDTEFKAEVMGKTMCIVVVLDPQNLRSLQLLRCNSTRLLGESLPFPTLSLQP